MNIRIATGEDAAELLRIYAPYVENTPVTFEYDVPSEAEFRTRILDTLTKYPYLVAEENGVPLGYAYASAFKSRAAYSWSAETSIYVREDCRCRGIGRMLYAALEELLQRQHVCSLCACIAFPNPHSIAFHKGFGYRTVAHFHSAGFKRGVWYDMIWMEKELCPHTIPPLPFLAFADLGRQTGKESLNS